MLSTTFHPRCFSSTQSTDSLDHYNPYSIQKSVDEEIVRDKFQSNTFVQLETGQAKNIQQLTTNDFLMSAKQSEQYSSLLARVDSIGCVDKLTGKAELRFYINGLGKMISYNVLEEMPFFVHQYSCWSSISPAHTRHICGLPCRQLECGDLILAISEQQTIPSESSRQPDYSQQSPTKCLVERYMNEESFTAKDNYLSKDKRF